MNTQASIASCDGHFLLWEHSSISIVPNMTVQVPVPTSYDTLYSDLIVKLHTHFFSPFGFSLIHLWRLARFRKEVATPLSTDLNT